jgi:D-amino-acid oxidase
MMNASGTDDGGDEACYITTRAAGGGMILGDSYQLKIWESGRSQACCQNHGAVAMCPELTGGKGIEHMEIRHGVGLRLVRAAGTRIKVERIEGF